jgi:enoyl-CoA hydratase/carnithine racemase
MNGDRSMTARCRTSCRDIRIDTGRSCCPAKDARSAAAATSTTSGPPCYKPRNAVESVIARFHLFACMLVPTALPTIAVLSGAAAGGGAALALLRHRYAAPDAKSGFVHQHRLVPDFEYLLLPALVAGTRPRADVFRRFRFGRGWVASGRSPDLPREKAESEAIAFAARLAESPIA